MNAPEYPPQNVSAGSLLMDAPAARASSITRSTSSGELTLWARVTPPQPPGSLTPESTASSARDHSPKTMQPAWKKTTSSVGPVGVQPSVS